MTVELKKQYNELLKRCNNAIAWLDSPERNEREIKLQMPRFVKILYDLNAIILQLLGQGDKMTGKQILEGFE